MLNNDTQRDYNNIMGKMNKIAEQSTNIIQKAEEYKIREERKKEEAQMEKEKEKAKRLQKLANECAEMLEKAMKNINYSKLVKYNWSPIDSKLIGNSFQENLASAGLIKEDNKLIIRLIYTGRRPLKNLEWHYGDGYNCSYLSEYLYQTGLKKYLERDTIPCIHICEPSSTGLDALDVFVSNEPVKKEYTKTRTTKTRTK